MLEQASKLSYPAEYLLIPDDALKILVCSHCTEPFNQPVTLDCGNSLCLACLSQIRNDTQKNPCAIATCTASHNYMREIHVDVVLAELTKICLNEAESTVPTIEECDYNQSLQNEEGYSECRAERVPGSPGVPKFTDLLSTEMECQICYQTFFEPVTTICGHTFCLGCLQRTYDHQDKCPMCRHQLTYDEVSHPCINHTLTKMLHLCLPDVMMERKRQLDLEISQATEEVPLFVCSLVFPGMPCHLHIFEPKYRLMIRRCMESRLRQFGMLLPGKHGKPFVNYGTMLKIKSIESLPDGRSIVQTVGLYRFKIKEHWNRDGYFIGKVERIEDDPSMENTTSEPPSVDSENSSSLPSLVAEESPASPEEMVSIVKGFMNSLRNGSAPWLLQRLDSTYGDMPNEPEEFSFWAASVIPIDEYEKYKLLTTTSTKLRLRMIVHWTELFREQWWFSRGGCATM
ncbi:hypothetical protein K493DRAFT_316989 [Basidiobolus meristosporus CBS 931.73]|uniref:LON-domain-containing protein n=1 Tax=Basidiobolus meristosporus CBS 931.73 TaxID=1314790 RepID=A0A1Y1Y1E1_9FUNG|nr:hypothetical protein K493DRAFT_316989 [Basidiobolus meristosporus CBS 931.73]|eukprot:ORX91832.1 hypothetical protein K493DRAFT_316989 [Basidiobolus meristosporus CBS 931.73]